VTSSTPGSIAAAGAGPGPPPATHLLQAALKRWWTRDQPGRRPWGNSIGCASTSIARAVKPRDWSGSETLINAWIRSGSPMEVAGRWRWSRQPPGAGPCRREIRRDWCGCVGRARLCRWNSAAAPTWPNTAEIRLFKISAEAAWPQASAGSNGGRPGADALTSRPASRWGATWGERFQGPAAARLWSRRSALQRKVKASNKALGARAAANWPWAKAAALVFEGRNAGRLQLLVARLDGVRATVCRAPPSNCSKQLGDGAAVLLGGPA